MADCEQALLDPARQQAGASGGGSLAPAYVAMVQILPAQRGTSADALLKKIAPVLEQEAREDGALWQTMKGGWNLDHGNTGSVVLQPVRDKQRALAQIGELLGLGSDGKGWMVFGDTTNDLGMLRWAEWSVAPANAKNTKAKEAAKEVSGLTNDQAFVADAIDRALGGGAGAVTGGGRSRL